MDPICCRIFSCSLLFSLSLPDKNVSDETFYVNHSSCISATHDWKWPMGCLMQRTMRMRMRMTPAKVRGPRVGFAFSEATRQLWLLIASPTASLRLSPTVSLRLQFARFSSPAPCWPELHNVLFCQRWPWVNAGCNPRRGGQGAVWGHVTIYELYTNSYTFRPGNEVQRWHFLVYIYTIGRHKQCGVVAQEWKIYEAYGGIWQLPTNAVLNKWRAKFIGNQSILRCNSCVCMYVCESVKMGRN